jgi:3-oxoacyl-[acyl-carrier protein] reductase
MPGSAVYSGTKGAVNAISGVLANDDVGDVVGPAGAAERGLGDEPGLHLRAGDAGAVGDARWVTGEVINASGGVR